MTQQVTHKVTQHLTGASYGENVKLLNSMIQVRRLKKKKKQWQEKCLKTCVCVCIGVYVYILYKYI